MDGRKGGAQKKRMTPSETRLVEAATTEVANRKSEIRVVLSVELGGTSVESGSGGGKTEPSTNLMDREVIGELADHEDHEGQIKKGKDSNQGDVDSQGRQKEKEADDEPGSQKDPKGVGELSWGIGVGSRNTKVWMNDGSVGQPETAERRESSRSKGIAGSKLPHSGKDLSKAADKTGHADDGVRNGDTASVDIVHGEDEGGARKGEETEGTRVADDPQLGGGVVHIGVGGESRSSVSSGTVVMFVTHVVGIVDGTLLVGDVAHDVGRV
jgi:hypothetical protein